MPMFLRLFDFLLGLLGTIPSGVACAMFDLIQLVTQTCKAPLSFPKCRLWNPSLNSFRLTSSEVQLCNKATIFSFEQIWSFSPSKTTNGSDSLLTQLSDVFPDFLACFDQRTIEGYSEKGDQQRVSSFGPHCFRTFIANEIVD